MNFFITNKYRMNETWFVRFHKILDCNSNECIWPHECLHIARNFYIIIRFVRHLISLFVSSHSFGYIFTFWQILFLIHYELIRAVGNFMPDKSCSFIKQIIYYILENFIDSNFFELLKL
ncbi:hypothetical protein DERP_015291 [Dermatophagoides pteronyssinus]|uniref:Uncharacterized protein n=1 Tax=Dermatophagoides pteronyssinus TaxID=6956 RepID=A0ABQ8J6E1_DERPT|nr:hypothetical protein DERP_015291 [Dermatophagoides pteronyssinus]